MSQKKLETMFIQKFWGVIELYYEIVQVVNSHFLSIRTVRRMFSYVGISRSLGRSKALVTKMKIKGTVSQFCACPSFGAGSAKFYGFSLNQMLFIQSQRVLKQIR